MFLENIKHSTGRKGWIEVVCGSMFSGKTEELIRRLKRAQFAKQKVEIEKFLIKLKMCKLTDLICISFLVLFYHHIQMIVLILVYWLLGI